MISRRSVVNFGVIIPAAALALVGCSGMLTTVATDTNNPSAVTTINPQILADAQAAVAETNMVVSVIKQYSPNAITPEMQTNINTATDSAKALLTSLSTATLAPNGASTLQQIETDLNVVLNAVGPVLRVVAAADPRIATAVTAYDLIVPLLPAIEAWTNTIIVKMGSTTAAPRKPILMAYTLEQARTAAALRLAAKKN